MKKPTEERRVFFFHYNKPASRQAGKPVLSVHWKGACHFVDNVVCCVPCSGKINKRQPYFVMRGYGMVRISPLNIAIITSV
jgi:hypothetical protein